MLSKLGLVLVIVGIGVGCSDGIKDRCTTADDCLPGLHCDEGICAEESGNNTESATGFGTVAPVTPANAGVTRILSGNQSMVGLTSAVGPLGCALVADMQAAPGAPTAAVYAVVSESSSSGDPRCPNGLFALRNNPSGCRVGGSVQILPQCALYKQWDASGAVVAERLAIGGYVMGQRTEHSSTSATCNVDVSLTFEGGITVEKTFSFNYVPFGEDRSSCVQ